MISKKFLVAMAAFAAGVSANASIQLSEIATLDLRATVSAEFNDNIYLNCADKESDVIIRFIPAADLRIGSEYSESSFRAGISEELTAYLDNDGNNTQNTHFYAAYNYAGAKLNGNVKIGYDMMSHNSARDRTSRTRGDKGRLVRYDTWYANATGDYQLTAKVSVSSGFKYSGKRYRNNRDRYADQERYAIPVSFWHALISDKLKGGISYEYAYTDFARYQSGVALGYQETHFIGLSLRGTVTEKLELDGRLGASVLQRHRRDYNNDDSTTLSFSGNAAYKCTEKTLARLSFSRDFEVSGMSDSIRATSLALNVSHSIDNKWSVHEGVSWMLDDYVNSDRNDNIYGCNVGVNYRMNDYLVFGLDYRFQWDKSNQSEMCFTNNIVTVSATAHF